MEETIARMSHTDLVAGFVAQVEGRIAVGAPDIGPVGEEMWREIVRRMDSRCTYLRNEIAPDKEGVDRG